jgi:hypothetical protein
VSLLLVELAPCVTNPSGVIDMAPKGGLGVSSEDEPADDPLFALSAWAMNLSSRNLGRGMGAGENSGCEGGKRAMNGVSSRPYNGLGADVLWPRLQNERKDACQSHDDPR